MLEQVPAWATEAVVATIVGLVLTVVVVVAKKAWRPIWRSLTRQTTVHVHVETDPSVVFANLEYDWISFRQFVPRRVEDLPPAPDGFATEMGAWAAELGGFPARHCNYGVTITARKDTQVVVRALRIKAKSVDLPEGCVVLKGVGGASMESRRIQVDLHTTHPRAKYIAAGGAPSDPFEFQLGSGESGQFKLYVDAKSNEDIDMYEWCCYFDLLVDGKPRTVRVGRKLIHRFAKVGNSKFRLVNGGRRPEYIHMPGSKVDWEPSPFA